jgi:hypothetical protein
LEQCESLFTGLGLEIHKTGDCDYVCNSKSTLSLYMSGYEDVCMNLLTPTITLRNQY